jgi:hypothetical protein
MPGAAIDSQRPRRHSVLIIGDWKRSVRERGKKSREAGNSKKTSVPDFGKPIPSLTASHG